MVEPVRLHEARGSRHTSGVRLGPPFQAHSHAPGGGATTKEITDVSTVVGQAVLTGRIMTMDALLPQRQGAQTIVDQGEENVMIVQENQRQRRSTSELGFPMPLAGDRYERIWTVDMGHGRIATRNPTTREALVGFSDWPGRA